MFRSRHLAAVVFMLCFAAAAAPGSAVAEPSGNGCGAGFDLGALTFDEYLTLPGSQAAIDLGLIDESSLLAGLAHFDHNGDKTVCVQDVPGWQISHKPFAIYMYNVVDNSASAG